jgi:integrase
MALTDVAVRAARPRTSRYRLSDGNSLYLKVLPSGRKTWEFRFKRGGTIKAYVIGPYPEFGLGAARAERDRLRREMRATGVDPLAARKKSAAEAELAREEAKAAAERMREERARQKEAERNTRLAAAKEAARHRLTVEALLVLWERHKLPVWSERSRDQIIQHANDYVLPVIGQKAVSDLRLADALAVVDPLIADGKIETARRVRQRLSEMLDYCDAHHHVSNNVVRLAAADLKDRFKRAHRDHPEKSHPTIPLTELPQLLRAMRTYVGTPVTRSLMWLITLTACRTGEARSAKWSEFRLDDGLWQIPAERMKAGRCHTVYLSPAAVALLRELKKETGKRPFVFAHPLRDDRPCSENAVLFALAAIGYAGRMTGHGFRHMFSTAANESGLFRHDVIEAALAHGDEDAIRARYNKATCESERRKLAAWWADLLSRAESGAANVLEFQREIA